MQHQILVETTVEQGGNIKFQGPLILKPDPNNSQNNPHLLPRGGNSKASIILLNLVVGVCHALKYMSLKENAQIKIRGNTEWSDYPNDSVPDGIDTTEEIEFDLTLNDIDPVR